MAKKGKSKAKPKGKRSAGRRRAAKVALVLTGGLILWGAAGDWFVHHPRAWLVEKEASLPGIVTGPLLWLGNPVADLTDGLGLTGHDAIYEYDESAPRGSVIFAGTPRVVGRPAPSDVRVLDRGDFLIGWSDRLRHAVWCAYHVTDAARHADDGKRPSFMLDRAVAAAPRPDEYTGSGYDRGHLAPNHAILSRYGEAAQRRTFLMSNIAPQSPALNRGVWKDVEHRIADLWTARYGEIWVIVGALPSETGETIPGRNIDVPSAYYQIILAQEGLDVRALAVLFPQSVPWDAWAARYITSIDEIETLTGLDFNPDLPSFIQDPLEAETPTRLWPVRTRDILRQVLMRFN